MLRRQAERHGERPLFVCGGEQWTFAEARGIAARYAGALLAAGIAPGDRVALLLCGNRPELLGLALGCLGRRGVGAPQCRGPRLSAPAHAEQFGRRAAISDSSTA